MGGLNQSVTTIFKSKDQTSQAFKKMSKRADMFGEASARAFKRANLGATSFKSVAKGILAAGAVQKGLGAIEAGVAAAGAGFVDFDDSITAATARFKDVQSGASNAADVMQQLRKTARATGADTQFTAAQMGQGLDFFARAGFKSAEAMAVLRSQVDLSTATGEEFARVADISSDLLGAMGMNSDDSATKIANLKNMNNLLAVAVNSANVTMEDLFETLKIAGPIATAAGESQETLIAMTAALGSAGIKGSMGATALKNAYIRLLDTTPEVDKALAKIGLSTESFVDKSGKMKTMVDIMKLLGKSTEKLGQAEQLKFFSMVFGKQAVAGATNLSKSLGEVDKIMTAMQDKNAMKKIADQMRTSLGPRIDILKSGLMELAFKVFTAFESRGKSALGTITTAVQDFNPQPIIDGLEKTISIVSDVIDFFKKTKEALSPFSGAIMTLVGAFYAYNTAIKIVAAGQAILNAVMLANPIGLIVAGVAALAAGAVFLYQNWDKVVETFKNVTSWFSALLDNPFIAGAAVLFAWPIAIPALIIKHWTPLVDFFAGIFNSITDVIKIAGRWVGFDMGKTTGEIETANTARRGSELSRAAGQTRTPPNKVQVDARQQVNFQGRIDINGAPAGSKAKTIQGPPGLNMALMGT